MAMASSAMLIRSPAVSSMSSSRPGGSSVIWAAWSSSSSVVSPIAETTTTTSSPFFLAVTMRSATRLMRSALATEDPPYFWTTRATRSGYRRAVEDPGEWLLHADERGNPATRLPPWTEGNLASPLVHGATYFDRLVDEV